MKHKHYDIETVADILALTPDQRVNCCKDLLKWCEVHDLLVGQQMHGVKFKNSFIWVDDGNYGVISGFTINWKIGV